MLKKMTFQLAIFFCFFQVNLRAVGLLTQYALASTYLKAESNHNEKEAQAFILGVWFPGIWYISESAQLRDYQEVMIQDLTDEKDYFKKGILFYHFLHNKEKKIVEGSLFDEYFDQETPYEIKECYLNILEDLLTGDDSLRSSAKRILNHSLYEEFSLENLALGFSLSDVIKWYFTVFISLDTHPLDIIDHMSVGNTYKGLSVNLKITSELLKEAKNLLPKMSGDASLRKFLTNLTSDLGDSFTGSNLDD